MNRLFSQKNGSNTGVSNQAGANISGKVKYRHSNQYYNEDGVPFHSKEEADRCIKGTNGNYPGWKPAEAFDTGILDQLDGTLGGVDFKA